MSEKDKQGEPKWCAKCENFALDDPKRMIGHCKINRLLIYAETLVPCTYFKGGIKMDNKVYVAEFEDYTISGESGILGIYDNFEDAQKRVDDFSKHFIKSDEKGPLGKAEVVIYDMNQAVICCAAEAYSKEK